MSCNREKPFEGTTRSVIQFKPSKINYVLLFLGAWENEPNGIKNKEAFIQYLDENLKTLNGSNKLKMKNIRLNNFIGRFDFIVTVKSNLRKRHLY
jgi:hypothetical protein